MQIHGFMKTTLLDYPGHVAATIFTGGCNFRCPFCHNASLVMEPSLVPIIDPEEVLHTLSKRKNLLSGVCITGGEPTLQHDLEDFILKLKSMGYLVKLDTNGTNPDMIITLFEKGLLDYVAMAIKSCESSYQVLAGISSLDLEKIRTSVSFLKSDKLPYEFRTTVVSGLHTLDDMKQISKWLNGAKAYFLQPYKHSEHVIQKGLSAPDSDTLESFLSVIRPYIPSVQIRGLEY